MREETEWLVMGLWALEAPALAPEVRHPGTLREDAHPELLPMPPILLTIISSEHEELLSTTICGIEFLSKLLV